jgi:tetratricopeptide (TPR) repeat protein
MDESERLEELLDRWEESRQHGQTLHPEELCRDCPELLPGLQQRIDGLLRLGDLVRQLPPPEGQEPAGSAGDAVPSGQETIVGPDPATSDPEPVPTAPIAAPLPQRAGRYLVQEQIAAGGMGAVLRVRDPDFERTLAVKVMLPRAATQPNAQQRFLEEARITGQLQHPGIPPVHEMGWLESGLPFFAMKLVQGQTLAALLKERPNPAHHLSRFVSIFRHVCQTLAYAHSRGIIHRDLKPGNIMVGAFGEVQVMDWGLAKAISHDKPSTPAETSPLEPLTVSEDHALSRTGDVMGTPGYMAPEQARGEIRTLDERCDDFGLGAILCEILTGRPPFCNGSALDRMLLTADGNLVDAFQRLDRCGADGELVTLARNCLSPKKEERPRRAGQVAAAVDRYETQVKERLRHAELEKAQAQTQAEEERKRLEVEQARAEEERKRRLAELAQRVEQAGRHTAEREQLEEENRRYKAEKQKAATERRLWRLWTSLPLLILPFLLFCCALPIIRFSLEAMRPLAPAPWQDHTAGQREAAVRHLDRGAALVQQKDYAGAITEFRQALTLDPNLAQAHINWGIALFAQKDYAGAMRHYEQAVGLDPTSARAHHGWGAALTAQQDYARAISHYQEAVNLNPNYAEARFEWGVALAKQRDYAGAIIHCQKAIALSPNFALAHGTLGEALLQQGEIEQAIQATKRAIQLLPPGDPMRSLCQDQLKRCQQLRQQK